MIRPPPPPLALSLSCLLLGALGCGGETPTPSGPPTATTALAVDMLAVHNRARANVLPKPASPLPALTWSEDAAQVAQAWANRCEFKHNAARGAHGENLTAAAPPGSMTDAQAVEGWVDEAAHYTYDTNTCASGKQCGHYTQVVWRNTTQVGCATAVCTTNSPFSSSPRWQLWVCNYAPPGNYVGQKPY